MLFSQLGCECPCYYWQRPSWEEKAAEGCQERGEKWFSVLVEPVQPLWDMGRWGCSAGPPHSLNPAAFSSKSMLQWGPARAPSGAGGQQAVLTSHPGVGTQC